MQLQSHAYILGLGAGRLAVNPSSRSALLVSGSRERIALKVTKSKGLRIAFLRLHFQQVGRCHGPWPMAHEVGAPARGQLGDLATRDVN